MIPFLHKSSVEAALLLYLFVYIVNSAVVKPSNAYLSDGLLLNSSSLLILSSSTNTSIFDSLLSEVADYPTTPDGCFDPPSSPKSRLLPTVKEDCYQAADDILDVLFKEYKRDRALTFGRSGSTRPSTRSRRGIDVELPQISKYKACRIYISILSDDQDTVEPWNLYGAALDLVVRCTTGGKRVFGGRRAVGPKGVIQMIMAGRASEGRTLTSGTS